MSAQAAVAALTPERLQRIRINRLGLWLFLFSDGLVFALLGTARFYINGLSTPDDVSQELGLAITSILLLSSLTAYRAETAFSHGNRSHGQLMLLATIALGLVFAVGVGIEWSIAEFVPSEPYGTSFFSMTGMHAAHVLSGVLFLVLIYAMSQRGHFANGDTWGVTGVVIYWHFVDIVWVFFYPTLYLVS